MSKYLDRAKELRAIITPHYNCGQSVILPFAEEMGIPEELVMRFAANYGRGMKTGALCGAVAGGATVLALYGLDDPASTEAYYVRIRESIRRQLTARRCWPAMRNWATKKSPSAMGWCMSALKSRRSC